MKKVMTSESLESTGYRCLFEAIKQEGIVPVIKLIQDIRNLPSKEILVLQTIAVGGNEIDTLGEKNKDIIKYLREHIKELAMLNITDDNLYNTLINLLNNKSLISSYLDNAKRLEYLKVNMIKFVKELKSFDANGDRYFCSFTPSNNKEGFQFVSKYYTDGEVFPRITEEQARKLSNGDPINQRICFSFAGETTFVLHTENRENFHQDRSIEITDFDFDGCKLPTEEEVQSYEIPKSLIKSYNEES